MWGIVTKKIGRVAVKEQDKSEHYCLTVPRACSGFCFELQMAKIHPNFVTKMLM
jgi:hypothetical protein